ncbi:Mitochondrial carrier protein MTM1 [Hondaea fermentalgiana]|uniref:Mitochondrial carrier protein MTM1 n=1 Tax=Hondaea fermentalgiana TaxID=2315210 RepID=A0A2R5GM47_9STRA|nr:Mitochondrial carrier protein MTM1 [Hondaea fermentalgiana]|eukprot:GBG30808.1 Mitochondrial carrier protein MTM1 [Hondaea fermentalgiana]
MSSNSSPSMPGANHLPDQPQEPRGKPLTELTLGQRVLSASVGALLTSMLVTPLDVVKTRLQAQAQHFDHADVKSPASCVRCTHYQFSNGLLDVMLPKETANHTLRECPYHLHNTADALYKITKHEGVGALYNGLRPSLIMAVPSTVLYFSSYDYLRNTLGQDFNMKPTVAALVAGSSARMLAATVISPLELVRTKMQASNVPQTMLHLVRTQIERKGVTSLWQGLSPTLFRDVPFSAIYWAVVERSKIAYRPGIAKWLHRQYGPTNALEEFTVSFFSGATGGMVAATLTNPFDVIKTRRQVFDYSPDIPPEVLRKEASSINIARKIFKSEGAAGFMVGLTPRLAKTIPACAIMLSSYEASKRLFANMS